MSITKTDIATMAPGWLWDDQTPGLGVRCTTAGAKSWVLRYRTRDRQQRSQTLGNATAIHPKAARELARQVLVRVAHGDDPLAQARIRQAAPTLADLRERYDDEHAPRKKPASRVSDRNLWDRHLLPWAGRRKLADLTPADVAQFLHDNRHQPIIANRAVRLLSKACNIARRRAPAWGWPPLSSNPAERAELHPENRRRRYLQPDEAQRLSAALTRCPNRSIATLVQLLLLTGARLSEWRDARWDWVDLRAGVLRLPDSKTGAKSVVLSAAAVRLLQGLPRVGPYVCPGKTPDAPIVGVQRPWQRLLKQAGIEGLRIHDLRHSYASAAVTAGLSLPQIGGLLGHRTPATTARYAHLVDSTARAAAERAAGAVAALISGAYDDL